MHTVLLIDLFIICLISWNRSRIQLNTYFTIWTFGIWQLWDKCVILNLLRKHMIWSPSDWRSDWRLSSVFLVRNIFVFFTYSLGIMDVPKQLSAVLVLKITWRGWSSIIRSQFFYKFLENQTTIYEKTRSNLNRTFLGALHGLISYTFMQVSNV